MTAPGASGGDDDIRIHIDDLEQWMRSVLERVADMEADELAPETYQAPDPTAPLGERRMTVGEMRQRLRAGLTRIAVERRMRGGEARE